MPKYSTTPLITQAIAAQEGFTSGASKIARENNNPGNIRFWSTRLQIRNGYTVFPTLADGWAALEKLVDDYTDGKYTGNKPPTLEQMFAVYSPSADHNDPVAYARFVSSRTGIPLGVTIKTYAVGGEGAPTPVVTPPVTVPPVPTYVDPTGDGGNGEMIAATEEVDPRYIIGSVIVIGLVFLATR